MPKGGARKGAGRKARPTLKAKGIWLGQITNEQRDFIMQWLSPEDRYGVHIISHTKRRKDNNKMTPFAYVIPVLVLIFFGYVLLQAVGIIK